MSENTILKESISGVIGLKNLSLSQGWDVVKDAVDYPVNLVNAYYKNKDGDFVNANGETNTGREKYFNLVVVDKFRDGDNKVISAVTGQYGSVEAKSVYIDFQNQLSLSEQDHSLVDLYVTGNGGAQQLTAEIKGMTGLKGLPDEVVMRVLLGTSVDGTKAHTLSLLIHNKTGDTSYSVYGGEYRLSARHTTTITDRTVDFVPSLSLMIKNWNDFIMPTMSLMADEKYDREFAAQLVEDLAKEAGIGERHRIQIRQLYEAGKVRTNDKSDSLYRVNAALYQYVGDELEEKRDLQERFNIGIAKAINKRVQKLRKN